jgi:hypothetical protein
MPQSRLAAKWDDLDHSRVADSGRRDSVGTGGYSTTTTTAGRRRYGTISARRLTIWWTSRRLNRDATDGDAGADESGDSGPWRQALSGRPNGNITCVAVSEAGQRRGRRPAVHPSIRVRRGLSFLGTRSAGVPAPFDVSPPLLVGGRATVRKFL